VRYLDKKTVACYNLLILTINILSIFLFFFKIIDLSFKNVSGFLIANSVGILCNLALLSRLKIKEKS